MARGEIGAPRDWDVFATETLIRAPQARYRVSFRRPASRRRGSPLDRLSCAQMRSPVRATTGFTCRCAAGSIPKLAETSWRAEHHLQNFGTGTSFATASLTRLHRKALGRARISDGWTPRPATNSGSPSRGLRYATESLIGSIVRIQNAGDILDAWRDRRTCWAGTTTPRQREVSAILRIEGPPQKCSGRSAL